MHADFLQRLREKIGVHTCDKRSNRTWISNHFNAFNIEPGFTEQDELWNADVRESNGELVDRAKLLLTDIFNHDNSSVISFTAHSGFITAMLEAIGHRPFPLEPGSIIAVLLKGEWKDIKLAWGPKPDKPAEADNPAGGKVDKEAAQA